MFNTKFTSIKEALTLNNLNEAQLVHHLQVYFTNQNYRKGYNQKKAALLKTPEVQALLKKMK